MAVKVKPTRSMNTIGTSTYEDANSYKVDDKGYLTVLKGQTKIATHAPDTWESVEIFKLLDVRLKEDREARKTGGRKSTASRSTSGRTKARKSGSTVTREGAKIRTSPLRGDKL